MPLQINTCFHPWRRRFDLRSFRVVCKGVVGLGMLLANPGGDAAALGQSVPRIGGLDTQHGFGVGTGSIVGIIDNGVNINHLALVGNDSLGRSRLVAQDNFVNDGNSAADSTGHGSSVAGVALADGTLFRGLAPDARYINARVSNASLGSTTADVIEGMDFAHANGADVFNLSLNSTAGSLSDGSLKLTLAADYFVDTLGIPSVVSAGNFGENLFFRQPSSPADGFNVITVGGTGDSSTSVQTYDQGWSGSAFGPIANGRSKPDIVAPAVDINTLGRFGSGSLLQVGTSFAAPHVTGVLALQTSYGNAQGMSTDPRVLKATLLNAAEKIPGAGQSQWLPGGTTDAPQTLNGVYTVTSPLDPRVGAGQIDAVRTYEQYAAGRQAAGEVRPLGWDLGELSSGETNEYELGYVASETTLTTTLAWHRQVDRIAANNNGLPSSDDSFVQADDLSHFQLDLLRDGLLVAQSVSAVDSIEHLHMDLAAEGFYTLRVRRDVSDPGATADTFGLSWSLRVDDVVPFFMGDLSGDAALTDQDLLMFTSLLTDTQAFLSAYGHNAFAAADINQDGQVNLADIEPFVLLGEFSAADSGALLSLVPEPQSALLIMSLGLLSLKRRAIS